MAKTTIDNLNKLIVDELEIYRAEVTEGIKKKNDECMKQFVKDTKKDAPKGKRKKFYKHIAYKTIVDTPNKKVNLWYVKDPEYRLTHLIKNGHQKRTGGRSKPPPKTKAQDFITNNYEKMERNYEEGVKEVIQNGY